MGNGIRDRILELKNLSDDWLNKLSIDRLDPAGLDWLANLFGKYPASLASPSHVNPWAAGVVFEWVEHPLFPSLEIDFATKKADWHAFKKYIGDSGEIDQFDLQDPTEWQRLLDRLHRLFNDAIIVDLQPAIEVDAGKRSGIPVLAGTRFTLAQLIAEMADGRSVSEIADDFSLDRCQLQSALHDLAKILDRPASLK